MRKHIIYYALCSAAGILQTACSNDIEPTTGTGTLCVQLSQQLPENITLNTRAVSQGLQVDVIDATRGTVYHFNEEEADAGLRALELPTGIYTLKGYSANYNVTYAGSEMGEGKWYADKTFNIQDSKQTRVGLEVPMTNFGVQFMLPEGIDEWFTTQTFTATYANRSITVPNNEVAYFDAVEGEDLILQLSLVNTDGETFQSQYTCPSNEVDSNTLYTVSYTMANNAPQLFIK